MNRENLERMIPIWYELDKSNIQCNMNKYTNGDIKAYEIDAICGTVMCGLGACPLYIPILDEEIDPQFGFSYLNYSYRIFDIYGDEWDWVFSDEWYLTDNTFKGVALRAKYLLDQGAAPANLQDQMDDKTQYIFRNKKSRELVL